MAQYHVLTRVEDGGAVALHQCIDNQQGELCVGLRQITYTVGWYNVGSKQAISWRSSVVLKLQELRRLALVCIGSHICETPLTG